MVQFLYFKRQGNLPLRFFIIAQALLFGISLYIVAFQVLPNTFFYNLFHAGQFSLTYGLDIVYLAVIQGLSYGLLHPFWFVFDFESIEERGKRIPILAGVIGLTAVLYFAFIGVYTYQKSFPHMLTALSSVLISFPGLLGILAFTIMILSVTYMVNTLFAIIKDHAAERSFVVTNRSSLIILFLSLWVAIFSTHIVDAVLFMAAWSLGFIPFILMSLFRPASPKGLKYNLIAGFIIANIGLFNLLPDYLWIGNGTYGAELTLNIVLFILSFIVQIMSNRLMNNG